MASRPGPVLKRLLLSLGGLVALLLLVGGGVFLNAHLRYESAKKEVHPDPRLEIEIPVDAAAIREGERVARMKGCFDCHGSDMAGKIYVEDPAIGLFAGTNLTAGAGGVAASYSDADWVRAIRYGRGRDKTYLRFMPSQEFFALTDQDLGRLIAYLKSLPPVDRDVPAVSPGPMAKILHSFGKMPLLLSGQNIDDRAAPVASLEASESPEYGRYLAASCVGCHNHNFGGGPIPGVPPRWPAAANLTPKGDFANWTFEDFKKVAATGITREGKELNPQFMPWPAMSAMNEVELKALFAFLKSLPAAETN